MPLAFEIRNGGVKCDMAQGHCACGASHSRAGWVWELKHAANPSFPELLEIAHLVSLLDRIEALQKKVANVVLCPSCYRERCMDI